MFNENFVKEFTDGLMKKSNNIIRFKYQQLDDLYDKLNSEEEISVSDSILMDTIDYIRDEDRVLFICEWGFDVPNNWADITVIIGVDGPHNKFTVTSTILISMAESTAGLNVRMIDLIHRNTLLNAHAEDESEYDELCKKVSDSLISMIPLLLKITFNDVKLYIKDELYSEDRDLPVSEIRKDN